jgi:hypothetical protein
MKLCISRGYASVSDLARQSIYQMIEESAELQQLKVRVIELERQLKPPIFRTVTKSDRNNV